MILKNGFVLDRGFRFRKTDLQIQGGKIAHIGICNGENEEVLDCSGKYVIPGLIDIHTHGCGNVDACDGTEEALSILSQTQGKAGITSFCPTTMTLPEEELTGIFKAIGAYMQKKPTGAAMAGVNMEGPFFNESKKGAQRGDCLLPPSVELYQKMNALCGGNIKLVDIAPELPGSLAFIKAVKGEVTVSIGHTAADYEIAMEAIQNGASHITHLYNAMNGLTHRAPGVVGAAADSTVRAELICDGFHIHPAAIRAAFKLCEDRICLISDSMMATGMPNGEYSLGGQKVYMTDGKAVLKDGTIAGSATNLANCMRKAVEFGIPLETAVKAATYTPAQAIRMEHKIGSIAVGLDADLIVMEKDLSFEKVFFKGELKQ